MCTDAVAIRREIDDLRVRLSSVSDLRGDVDALRSQLDRVDASVSAVFDLCCEGLRLLQPEMTSG